MKWPADFVNKIVVGDCREILKGIPENSIAAVVCDPPYGIRFMGKSWDGEDIEKQAQNRQRNKQTKDKYGKSRKRPRASLAEAAGTYDLSVKGNVAFQIWCKDWARACLRVLKPGGHLVSFGGTRTYHRMACAIEDAGFEIRDQLQWLYGSGFPKSLDVSKAIDKAAGASRTVIGSETKARSTSGKSALPTVGGQTKYETWDLTKPATDEAKQWSGWGTALKPANEPICLARKPISEPTVAANVLKWGTGALNIESCRIGESKDVPASPSRTKGNSLSGSVDGSLRMETGSESGHNPNVGRWPANVILDEEAGRQLDEQSGGLTSGANPARRGSDKFRDTYGEFKGQTDCVQHRGADTGGASRFFYCAKTSKEERNTGLAGDQKRPLNWSSGTKNPGSFQAEGTDKTAQNFHPTVKPVDLMKWLVQLVTPPCGIVLDQFVGSGSTLLACAFLNVEAVGIEISAEYAVLARKRIANEMAQGKLF